MTSQITKFQNQKMIGDEKMSILNVEHLTHGFGDRAIFNDVSFRLLKGEHIGLVGANGEGKSTFMNIIITGKARIAPTMTAGIATGIIRTMICFLISFEVYPQAFSIPIACLSFLMIDSIRKFIMIDTIIDIIIISITEII